MTSYALVESLPYSAAQRHFQNSVHPMAVQQIPIDRSYGYEALTHGHQPSNNSGYFSMQTGYGNDNLKVGYDSECIQSHRDVLGVVTYPKKNNKQCGCTHYVSRNCTGQFKPKNCTNQKSCSNSAEHVCCHPGFECGPRKIGDSGTCIAGVPRKN